MRLSVSNQFFYVNEVKTLPSGKTLLSGSFTCPWEQGGKEHSNVFADVFPPKGSELQYAKGDKLVIMGDGNIKHFGDKRRQQMTIWAEEIKYREEEANSQESKPAQSAPADEHDDLPF